VGFARGGVLMASRYAGLIGSFSNIYAYIAAIIMPYVVGAMAEHGTVEEWRHTAFLVAGVLALSFIQFQIFGSAEQQKWAIDDKPNRTGAVYAVEGKERTRISEGP